MRFSQKQKFRNDEFNCLEETDRFIVLFSHHSVMYLQENNMVYDENEQQGKSEGFDSCDWPSNLTQIGFKSSIFQPV